MNEEKHCGNCKHIFIEHGKKILCEKTMKWDAYGYYCEWWAPKEEDKKS